jgi:mannose-6-phosphate isomerase-like protein (cupin superfamily)
MLEKFDLDHVLRDLPRLRGRGAHTSEEELRRSIRPLAGFRDGGLFASSFSGSSGWERHPAGDEIVHILAGSTRFDIILDDEIESHELRAGTIVVVPRGAWHRFESSEGVTVLTATPQPTEHHHVDDPRVAG